MTINKRKEKNTLARRFGGWEGLYASLKREAEDRSMWKIRQ